MKRLLFFVYNADSGIFSAVSDAVHKMVSPDTYDCNLCKLSFDAIRMRPKWKQFLDSLDTDVEFLHRDEFQSNYPNRNDELPAIFAKQNDTLEVLVPAHKLNQAGSLDELIELVRSTLDDSM